VFYQITKGATKAEKENLGMMDPQYFRYLNCTQEYSADGIDDVEEYTEMKQAMDVCHIEGNDRSAIFNILAAVLHLGNIDFIEDGTVAAIKDLEGGYLLSKSVTHHSSKWNTALAFPAYLLVRTLFYLAMCMLIRAGNTRRNAQG
jgi:hypothetical protein